MLLRTATNRLVRYPDRLSEGLVWIELASQAQVQGHQVLADEVGALAASGLLIQLELGVPVVKLLNITSLLFDADGEPVGADAVTPALNLIGMLAGDDVTYEPERVVRTTLASASPGAQERFASAPDAFGKVMRFMRAIGAGGNAQALDSPWIHLTVDRPGDLGGTPDRDKVTEAWPWLADQTLWWLDDLEASSRHLFRISSSDDPDEPQDLPAVLVPLPVTTPVAGPGVNGATVASRTICTTAGDRSPVGFSLTRPVAGGGSAAASTAASELIDAAWAFIDARS